MTILSWQIMPEAGTEPFSSGCAPKEEERAMASKRELIEPHPGDKRYVRRDEKGRFKESDDVGRSLAADRRQKAKNVSEKGQGDKGDRKK
jgi:hypothetical protein